MPPFSDIRNYILISEIFFLYQKLFSDIIISDFLISGNNFWYKKNRISDIRKSFSDIRKSVLKSYHAFHITVHINAIHSCFITQLCRYQSKGKAQKIQNLECLIFFTVFRLWKYLLLYTLTHLPWTKWAPFWQTTFSKAFSWMKMIELGFKFHWSLFWTV